MPPTSTGFIPHGTNNNPFWKIHNIFNNPYYEINKALCKIHNIDFIGQSKCFKFCQNSMANLTARKKPYHFLPLLMPKICSLGYRECSQIFSLRDLVGFSKKFQLF